MKFVIVKNSRGFAVKVVYKNSAGDQTETVVPPGKSVEVPESEKTTVETQITDATEPKVETPVKPEAPAVSATDMTAIVKNAIESATAPLLKQVNDLEQKVFDNSAQEPQFRTANKADSIVSSKVSTQLSGMNWRERHAEQINAAWAVFKDHDTSAFNKLKTVNAFHLEKLQEAGIVPNSVTLGDFGNFVISPELLKEIEGFRSDFGALIAATNWQETLSLQMAWLNRSGDINMQEVEMCDDGEDGNLKPISEYSAEIKQSNLHELAAVTPVCNAATRFLAADLLGDVAEGYRTDYDRKRAQLVIARLQQAINETGQQIAYNKSSATSPLISWIQTMTSMQEEIMNGVFVFNQQTYGELLATAVSAGINGPLAGLFTTGNQPLVAGRPYIIVPNELMPSLNSGGTRSFTVEGQTVTIREGAFYAELSKFKGRTSGGLKYDLSTEAAYEQNSVVKSAFQRNELVLRGSFFRGGAFTDNSRVVGLVAAGIS